MSKLFPSSVQTFIYKVYSQAKYDNYEKRMYPYGGEEHSKGETRMSLKYSRTTSIVLRGVCDERCCLVFTVLIADEGSY